MDKVIGMKCWRSTPPCHHFAQHIVSLSLLLMPESDVGNVSDHQLAEMIN